MNNESEPIASNMVGACEGKVVLLVWRFPER